MSRTYISAALRRLVAERAERRCEYCQSQEIVIGMPFEVEHVIPEVAGGSSDEANLALACPRRNRYKGTRTVAVDPHSGEEAPLFHPRQQQWPEHFTWQQNGLTVAGLTPAGRATAAALQMNNPFDLRSRRVWIRWGWHPPQG